MRKGHVRWYRADLGYGFIDTVDAEPGEDIFFHYSTIQMDGFRAVPDGIAVEFETEVTRKGVQATIVIPLRQSPGAMSYPIIRHGRPQTQPQT